MAYDLQKIRTLLIEGFSIDELRRFCFDHPDFRAVHHQLSPEMGQDKVIDRLLEHAERTLRFELLLAWAKEHNPARYEVDGPYAAATTPPPNPQEVSPAEAASGVTIGDVAGGIHGSIIVGRDVYISLLRQDSVPFQAPPLPAHFIPRPEVTDAIKSRLLTNALITPGILVISAIHGLGGIGKSTLAAALAYDKDVQQRFKDGILWATLGQQPDLLSQLGSWVQALGDYDFRPTTVEATTPHLRTLLQDKATLLVVDDVWEPAHAFPFRVGGPKSRVIITTRRADVAEEVGAELHQMDVMTPEQALALLSSRLNRLLQKTEQGEALALAKDVGYLPLALELATARIARGVTWASLREALKVEIVRLEGPRRRRSERSRLEASFNLSLNALRAEYEAAWQAFVWLGILPEDVRITVPMAAILWEMEETEATEMLELLWNDALLLPAPPLLVSERQWPAYRLHDLLHNIARHLLIVAPPQGLGLDLSRAHGVLLARYQKYTSNSLWHTLSDNGYIHAHLVWHMEQAGQVEQIHTLLREETTGDRNAWYEAQERLGQTANYLADIARAWRLSEEMYAKHKSPIEIGLQCRYALIAASLKSLAVRILPDLLLALVEKDIWTPIQGIAYTQQMPDQQQQAEAIVGIAPFLPEQIRRSVLPEVLAVIQRSGNIYRLKSSLSTLALRLGSQGHPQEALAIAQEIDKNSQPVWTLIRLVSKLVQAGYSQEALAIAQEINVSYQQEQELIELVSELVQAGYSQEALAVTEKIDDPRSLQRVMAAELAKLLAKFGHLEEGLNAIEKGEDEKWQSTMLTELAPYLSEPLLKAGLELARRIVNPYERSETLSSFAKRFATLDAPKEAMVIVQEITDDNVRDRTFSKLIPDLPETLKLKAIQERLVIARGIKSKHEQEKILKDLAPQLPESLLQEGLTIVGQFADGYSKMQLLKQLVSKVCKLIGPYEGLVAAQKIEGSYYRVVALLELKSYLPEPLMEEALQEAIAITSQIEDEKDRAAALLKLAPHLPELLRKNILEEALDATQYIEDELDQRWTLSELAFCFTELGYPYEGVTIAQKIDETLERIEVLLGLIPYLSNPLKEKVLQEGLSELQIIEDWGLKGDIVYRVVSQLVRRNCLDEGQIVAQKGEHGYLWGQVISEQVYSLAKGGRPLDGLALAHKLKYPEDRVECFFDLFPYLPEPYKKDALRRGLAAAWKLENQDGERDHWLASYAIRLARHDYLPKALEIIREIEHTELYTEVVSELVTLLPESLLSELLTTAQYHNTYSHARALLEVLPRLPKSMRADTIEYILTAARNAGDAESCDYILSDLAPQLAKLGYLQKALATAYEIELINTDEYHYHESQQGETLSRVIPYLSKPLLREVLARSRKIEDEWHRSDILARLTVKLAEIGHSQEALAIAQRIENPDTCIEILLEMTPYLPETLRDQVLLDWSSMARLIKSKWHRARILSSLAPELPESIREKAAQEALEEVIREIGDPDERANILLALLPNLSESLTRKTIQAVLNSNNSWNVLARLAELGYPQLVLEAMSEIEDQNVKVRMLSQLAPYLPEPQKDAVIQEVLRDVQEIYYLEDKAVVFLSIASHLSEPVREEILQEGLKLANEINGRTWRGDTLLLLISQLIEWGQLQQGVEVALKIKDGQIRAKAYSKLLPHLSESLLSDILRKEIGDAKTISHHWETEPFSQLVSHLQVPQLLECLAVSRDIEDDYRRVEMLSRLASYLAEPLKEEVLQEILAVAQNIKQERMPVAALKYAMSHLPESLLQVGISVAQEIKEDHLREELLLDLALLLAKLDETSLYPLFCETLHKSATRSRGDLLSDLNALAPVIATLGGSKAITETFQAIQDVGRWWP